VDEAIRLLKQSLKDTPIGNTIAEYITHAESLDPQCRRLVLQKAMELARKYESI